MADIATDHALLPIALVRGGRVPRAIAIDIAAEPLRGAAKNVQDAGLERSVELRRGDGLAPLSDGEVASIVIAGVGGVLCSRMLEAGIPEGVERLVLQVNAQRPRLRATLQRIGWPLVDEWMDQSDGRYFVTMVAEPGEPPSLDAADLEFGPHLRARRSATYLEYLRHELERTRGVVERLPPQADNEAAREARRRLVALRDELGE
jgi:tRNA (adenine22-N1)-methyltransferase